MYNFKTVWIYVPLLISFYFNNLKTVNFYDHKRKVCEIENHYFSTFILLLLFSLQ